MILDTGSSDTYVQITTFKELRLLTCFSWVMKQNFTCYNMEESGYYDYEYVPVASSACGFGPTYNGTFQGGQIANVSAVDPRSPYSD